VRPRPAVPDARNIETFLALASLVDLSAGCGPVSPMAATPAPCPWGAVGGSPPLGRIVAVQVI
jgi:hypothetical protein